MGARNTPEQTRAYSLALRERRRAEGLVRKDVWVHPDDWPEVKALVARQARARVKGARSKPKEGQSCS
jgi:hypothetical protein